MAEDYDILNDFGQTDHITDLFAEIEKAYEDKPSIFDVISEDDLIFAFFPCTRFEAKIPLWFRGQAQQQKSMSVEEKLKYSMLLHKELHRNYTLICKLCLIAIRRKLRLIIENPYTAPHYLTVYWCLKPSVIDRNRRENGDYQKKPTQYWFIGLEPHNNLVFEPLEYVEYRTHDNAKGIDGKSRAVMRSMIHPQYARRFILQYIL